MCLRVNNNFSLTFTHLRFTSKGTNQNMILLQRVKSFTINSRRSMQSKSRGNQIWFIFRSIQWLLGLLLLGLFDKIVYAFLSFCYNASTIHSLLERVFLVSLLDYILYLSLVRGVWFVRRRIDERRRSRGNGWILIF